MTYNEILSAMRLKYRELAGFDADQASDIGIRLKVLAAEVTSVYERITGLKNEVFPQTSTGRYLELHAESRAITRKPAIASTGVLRFSRETPAYSDISIPAGILCSTKPDPQVYFETLEDVVLPVGESFADVPAAAVDSGDIGNVAVNAVSMMISPANGITSVTNPGPFSGGVDAESDDALRSRLLAAYQNISNGTNRAFYYDLAMGHEGVSSANVLPRRRGRGTVDVVISCRVAESQNEIAASLQAELNERKEINVDVLVIAAVQDKPAISAQIAVRDGYNLELVSQAAAAEIKAYTESLGVGEPLLLAAVGSRLLAVDGVYNYKIIAPSKDVVPANDHVLRPDSVTVSGMAVG